jgi:hypothetical protein
MRFVKETNGQATTIVALCMGIVMFGFAALALDVGVLFRSERMAQAAADAAAVAAAEEIVANDPSNEQEAANAMAKLNGLDTTLATNPAVVTLTAGTGTITAVASQPIPTVFLGAFRSGMGTMTVSASASASANQASPSCVCLTGQTGTDLNMSNNAQFNATNCGITDDSNGSKGSPVTVVGSASVNALSLSTVGTGWDNSTNINNSGTLNSTKVITGIATPCAPAITVPTLPNGITCYDNPINGWVLPGYTANYTLPLQNVTLTNGTKVNEVPTSNTFCYNSLNLSDASSVTFTPGYTYYIKGDFTTGGGAPVTGNGVQFVITGNIDIANGVTVNLTAPTDSNGVPETLFYNTGSTVTIEGGSNSNLSGLIYAPNAAMTLNNGTGTTTNMDIVAQTLTMAGGAALNSYASPALGTLNSTVAKLTQ